MIMNDLPLHLIDEILFRMEARSMAMMRCTNKSFKSYLNDPRFGPQHPSWVRSSLFYLSSYGAGKVYCLPSLSTCNSKSPGNEASLSGKRCYILGSCSGLLLLYIGYLFVANPFTKRFRILDHSGSTLLPQLVGGVEKDDPYDHNSHLVRLNKAMCVGFVVDRYRTTKRMKIVCILEMETMYRFEISDGDSWSLSKTTITTSSETGLKKRMKPVYVNGNLYWLRNDWSLIAFNPETEQARLIPSSFIPTPDTNQLFTTNDKINLLTLIVATRRVISVYTLLENHEWRLTKKMKNVPIRETELDCWNVVAFDGKCLVVREENRSLFHVYDMEANSWGILWSTTLWFEDYYEFKPSLFSIEVNEQTKVIVASDDQHISCLTRIIVMLGLTKPISLLGLCWAKRFWVMKQEKKLAQSLYFVARLQMLLLW